MSKNGARPPPESSPSFVRRLVAGVALLNICVYTISGLYLWQSWCQHEKAIEVSTQNLTHVLENSIVGFMEKADAILLGVADEAERQLAAGGVNGRELDAMIARKTARVPELDNLWVSNAKGDLVQGTRIERDTVANIADREYFRQLRDKPDLGMFLSKPILGRVSKQWVVIMARRVNHPDGSFFGVVIGSFSIEFLTKLFADIDIGPKGTIALRDSDLEVVARHPEPLVSGSTIGQKSTMEELSRRRGPAKPPRHSRGAPASTMSSAPTHRGNCPTFPFTSLPAAPSTTTGRPGSKTP